MKAAVIHDFAQPPRYDDFQTPQPDAGEVLVKVEAAAVSQLVRAQASGKHYSSGKTLPVVPGFDGVGQLEDGSRVYFAFPTAPFGALAQQSKVRREYTVPLPAELDSALAAALANPGMSSWAALTRRAHLQAGEHVLINGATGTAGRLAVQIARHLGAGRIVATGRNEAVLRDLGADEIIVLNQEEDALTETFRQSVHRNPVQVVLDYLWGMSAHSLLSAFSGHADPEGEPRVRFVQIGSMSGAELSLNASTLRSSGVELLGSGLGSVPNRELVAAIGEMLEAAATHGWTTPVDIRPLAEVETAWNAEGSDRLVLVN
ncbi:alcohol dehydrogenase [Deinococcus piscis]|uniref:Alcohol dehydrogenase n=1 Tax=Deinococcus piscis TaxID=394230 RepID=A0ABQ3KBB4_9DEIO|nr:zinc-binding alcohol dehydrogenase family protein [Deinococcus piscis]GHG10039.1 alcohol dehydrogenase [Deinococcus piscis]